MKRTYESHGIGPRPGTNEVSRRRTAPALPQRFTCAIAEALEDRRLLADTVAPFATLVNAPATNAAGQAYNFGVQYRDDVAINPNSISTNDVLVRGPGGINALATLTNTINNGNGSYTGRYTVPAPPLPGTYSLEMQAGEVSDTSGNFVPPSVLGSFQQDTGAQQSTDMISPTASITGQPSADPSGLGYNISITYVDDTDILDSTIGTGDIRVTGPNFDQVATLISSTTASPAIRVVKYRVPNPVVKGTYTVNMVGNQVSDSGGNFVAAGTLGTFNAGFASSGGGGVTSGGGANFFNPDVAAAVTDVPTKAATLGKGKVSVRVTNLGDTKTSGKVDVSLFLSPNRVLGSADTMIVRKRTVVLHGGESRTFTYRVRFPDVPAGDYFIAAQADQNNTLKEANENNNVGFSSKTVAISVPSVDLAPMFVSSLPSVVVGGDSGNAVIRIFNKGTAKYNTSANITLYASADGVLDTAVDPVVKQVSGLPLRISQNGRKDVGIDFNYPSSLTDGTYRFIAVVDSGNAVDTNPNNNAAITPDQVLIRAAYVDLRADSISVTSGPLIVGATNTVEVTVTNLGNVSANGTLGIALTATSPTLAGEVPLTKFTQSVSIGPFETQTFRINFLLPASLPSNTNTGYFFKAVLDPDNVFGERDETNNEVSTLNPFPTA